MNKIWLIIRREYLSRVRNRTFILLTLLGPVLYIALIFAPVMIAKMAGDEVSTVGVIDSSGRFEGKLQEDEELIFVYLPDGLADAEEMTLLEDAGIDFLLKVPPFEEQNLEQVQLVGLTNPGLGLEEKITSRIARQLGEERLQELGISREVIENLEPDIEVETSVVGEEGTKASSSGATAGAAMVGGFLIYFFIFLYGGLVLRGVQEEKSNRIVEIIISSVRPFQLMLGKILGIALVGLTQFGIWVLLTLLFTTVAGVVFGPDIAAGAASGAAPMAANGDAGTMNEVMASLDTLPVGQLVFAFIFFFLGGYLLYSSLFASFAAAVDSQADTYQFMFPASIPLLFSIVTLPTIIDNPDSGLVWWLSMIPFTSPVIMVARIPFGVPLWELLLSMALLVVTFLFVTWLAGRIYRVGILLYGSKPTLKQMWRWVTE